MLSGYELRPLTNLPHPLDKRSTYIYLQQAQLCIDCEAIFEGEGQPCPACSSTSSHPVCVWLGNGRAT